MAFGRETLPQTCAMCGDADLRARWGCDEDTPDPQLWIVCPRCLGQDHACQRCNGEGREAVRRCPLAIQRPEANEACSAVVLMEQGILPVAGGLYDQAALFIEALGVISAGRAFIEEERESRGSH